MEVDVAAVGVSLGVRPSVEVGGATIRVGLAVAVGVELGVTIVGSGAAWISVPAPPSFPPMSSTSGPVAARKGIRTSPALAQPRH